MLNMFQKDREGLQERFNEIVKQAIIAFQNKPIVKFVASYSGGSDSAVMLELARHCPFISLDVMSIDTQLSTDGHITRVYNEVVQQLALPLKIYTNDGQEWYRKQTLEEGFGYTLNIHIIYYRMLKERTIETYLRDHKTNKFDQIFFFTGVRRLESPKRAKTPLWHKKGSRITVNPIDEFTDFDKKIVLNSQSWYKSKTTEDCMCNWHCKYSIDDLVDSPMLYDYIDAINQKMKENNLWLYGETPSAEYYQPELSNDKMPEDSFCINCYSKALL